MAHTIALPSRQRPLVPAAKRRASNYEACNHTSDKPTDDPLLSDGHKHFCVFTDDVPGSCSSLVSQLSQFQLGQPSMQALARIEDPRMHEPQLKKKLGFL